MRKKGNYTMRIPQDHLTKGGLLRLLPDVISGAEDDEQGDDDGDKPNPPKKTNDKSSEGSSGDDGDEGEDDDNLSSREDLSGLKSALEKERKERKRLEKELKAKQKAEAEAADADKTEGQRATSRAEKAEAAAKKLAAGLLKRDLHDAIRKEAEKLKFIDPSDAIEGVDFDTIDFTQDEDDPSDIEIDVKTVEKAVKALATKKPHFISKGTDDGKKTGSTFGGKQDSKKDPDAELKELYPALRR